MVMGVRLNPHLRATPPSPAHPIDSPSGLPLTPSTAWTPNTSHLPPHLFSPLLPAILARARVPSRDPFTRVPER